MLDRILRGALGAALVVALAGCSEQVTSSLACPELCSDQTAQLRDTVLTETVTIDTTFLGFPRFGTLTNATLVAQGDTADVRVVARFDTLPNLYRPTGAPADSAITFVDSATLIFVLDTAVARPTGVVTLEAFDVDTTAADTIAGALLPLFRPDRLIGSASFTVTAPVDTTAEQRIEVPLNNAVLLEKMTAGKRLRVGLRLTGGTGPGARRIRINRVPGPIIRYRASTDTLVKPDTIRVQSNSPAEFPPIAAALRVFPVIAAGVLPPPPPSLIAVGGLAGARTYMKFNIPAIVLDSVEVIRATLQLTQRPARGASASVDTLSLVVNPVIAGPAITDIYTASQFIGSPAGFLLDTLRLVPRDSGRRELEIKNLVRAWRGFGAGATQRALVLRVVEEGELPGELDFFASDSPVALRPTLRLTYVPRRGFGLP